MFRISIPRREGFVFGLLGSALAMLLLSSNASPAQADDQDGASLYRANCARCHGANGEGNPAEYPHPLVGERSVGQLARLIFKTMPADEPGTCTEEEARALAEFVHESFYSPLAQARNMPARVALSRLTVKQYRNTLSDLMGEFLGRGEPGTEQGLRGAYYKGRRTRRDDRAIQRVDREVRFDFGVESPDPDTMPAPEFTINWEGALLAPDTGEYEFVVRTEHAARLWVNDRKTALIDAWVKSGSDTEYRGSIFLLGGRAYPIKLEFSKAKQGVDDSKKREEPPPPVQASISLSWQPPGQAEQIIPARFLRTGNVPELFVAKTPFPPDDRSVGYERGTAISKEWDQATTDAAIELAGYVVANLDRLAGLKDAEDRLQKARAFCERFVSLAIRRPLDDELRARYVSRHFEAGGELESMVKRVVLLALKSPRFLYREIDADGLDAYEVTARLAYSLWDAPPDETLRRAAEAGELSTPEQIAQQAERMASDPRTRVKLREFLLQWLKVEPAPEIAKDEVLFPDFDGALVSDLRGSLELMLNELLESETADLRNLLLSEDLYLNGRLAAFYGANLPGDADFQKVRLGSGERAGVLTHPYILAHLAYTSTSSPIHRGVFLARNVLGRTLRQPPEAAAPLTPDLHPGLSTRERVTLQTKPEACQSCHAMINPLGFTLERFDAVGRLRDRDGAHPVDAHGVYLDKTGNAVDLAGARALGEFLAASEETHSAFVTQLFHHLVKQPVRAFGPTRLSELTTAFAEDDYNIRKLAVRIALISVLGQSHGDLAAVGRADDARGE